MPHSVRRRYQALAEQGDIEPDARQLALADSLDALLVALAEHGTKSKQSALGWLLARGTKPVPPRGLYIWGPVGRGKTLLMDLFFAAAPTPAKRRLHFHAFMGDVHERIGRFRAGLKSGGTKSADPIPPVAAEIASEIRLLCFDEFSVGDIADAMILGRLFQQLFARGVTVVATSNTAPDDLYKHGLNRPLFLPFIALLKQHMATFHLDAPRDYRRDDDEPGPLYLTPLGAEADARIDGLFNALAGASPVGPRDIVSKGRRIAVPTAADGVARFGFGELCARPLGAGDFLRIAAAYPTILVTGVPLLGEARRDEARRFINLIDALYDSRTRLIISAAAEPDALWQGPATAEGSAFARTASRLTEMRSQDYWRMATEAHAAAKKARAV